MTTQLSTEEQATNYITVQHIMLVQHHLNIIVKELLDRGELHDKSKLEPPEVEAFTAETKNLSALTYGSPEYHENLKRIKPALDHHYARNRHHPEFHQVDEEWRAIAGYEGHYEVSNYGNVRSLDRVVERSGPTGNTFKPGQMRKQEVTPKGYCRVQLRSGEKYKNYMVHCLVAEAFIPNPDNKPEVNHVKGEQKANNRVSNLEWSTTCENVQHAYDTGLMKGHVKYVVHCEELDITTFGCEKMAAELRKRGYDNASSASIWRVANHGGKHLDLEFTANKFETWMDSPVNRMTIIDLIEMLCDWAASCKRHENGNLRKSIEINADRFSMSPQLTKILENSVGLFE